MPRTSTSTSSSDDRLGLGPMDAPACRGSGGDSGAVVRSRLRRRRLRRLPESSSSRRSPAGWTAGPGSAGSAAAAGAARCCPSDASPRGSPCSRCPRWRRPPPEGVEAYGHLGGDLAGSLVPTGRLREPAAPAPLGTRGARAAGSWSVARRRASGKLAPLALLRGSRPGVPASGGPLRRGRWPDGRPDGDTRSALRMPVHLMPSEEATFFNSGSSMESRPDLLW